MVTANAYFAAALTGVLALEAVSTGVEVLNLRRLRPELPADFAEVYEAETYATSQRYMRAKTRFGFVTAGFDLALLLVFWLVGGFGWFDGVLRQLGIGPVFTGLLFLLALLAARGILELPFGVYSIFVIEERFGFNKTTPRTFILDVLKSALVSAAFGVPLLAGFLAVFQYLGWYAWIVAWVAAGMVTIILQLLLPTFVLPLFNKFSPLADGELRSAIFSYAARVHFPLKAVYVIDASRRSTKGNAYFTGFGNSKRVALFDTIVERHSVAELVAILAHEIGHYKKRHILMGTVVGVIEMGLFLGLFSVLSVERGLFEAFGVPQTSVYTGIVFVAVLLRPLQFFLSIGDAALSRHNERQADSFAAGTTDGGGALAAGLARLSKDSLSSLTPHPLYVLLNYSHPPVLERVRRLGRHPNALAHPDSEHPRA